MPKRTTDFVAPRLAATSSVTMENFDFVNILACFTFSSATVAPRAIILIITMIMNIVTNVIIFKIVIILKFIINNNIVSIIITIIIIIIQSNQVEVVRKMK
jgi:hypothetical protein